jgi:hypothetical protein
VLSVFTLERRGLCTGVVVEGVGPMTARHGFVGFADPRSAVGLRARVRSPSHVVELEVVAELRPLDLVVLSPIPGHASVRLRGMLAPGQLFVAVGVGRSGVAGRVSAGTSRIGRCTLDTFLAQPDPDIACDGDSGGPALADGRVFGIASGYPDGGGAGECCGQPVEYSRLDGPAAREWLRRLASAPAARG